MNIYHEADSVSQIKSTHEVTDDKETVRTTLWKSLPRKKAGTGMNAMLFYERLRFF